MSFSVSVSSLGGWAPLAAAVRAYKLLVTTSEDVEESEVPAHQEKIVEATRRIEKTFGEIVGVNVSNLVKWVNEQTIPNVGEESRDTSHVEILMLEPNDAVISRLYQLVAALDVAYLVTTVRHVNKTEVNEFRRAVVKM